MADYITAIRTADGDKQIDYNALANKPDVYSKTATDALLDAKVNTSDLTELVSNISYTKDETLSEETKELYGYTSDATPDDVFRVLSSGSVGVYGQERIKYKPLLKKINNVAVGPYTEDESNYIGDYSNFTIGFSQSNPPSNYTASEIYWSMMCPSAQRAQLRTFANGRYSYCFYKQQYAFKLDHLTRTGELLADLSSYVGTYPYDDQIFAIDDEYIYYAQHTEASSSACYGTIYKFDHSGNVISSVTETETTMWHVDLDRGWSGTDYGYMSCFAYSHGDSISSNYDLCGITHTKDYIIILYDTGTTSDDNTNYFIAVVSKNTLKVVIAQHAISDVSSYNLMPGLRQIVDYNNNALLYFEQVSDASLGAAYCFNFTDSGVTVSSTENAYPTIQFNDAIHYIDDISSIVNGSNRYYLLDLDNINDSNNYYTIVTQNDINLSSFVDESNDLTSCITINYLVSDSIPFDEQYYDPVVDDFDYYGESFELYPAYVAPSNYGNTTIADGYTMLPYFKVGNDYHFLRTSDNKIFKLNALTNVYSIDRLEEVE